MLDFVIAGDDMRIEDLRPGTKYMFRVRARNEVGLGEPVQLAVTTGDVGEFLLHAASAYILSPSSVRAPHLATVAGALQRNQ